MTYDTWHEGIYEHVRRTGHGPLVVDWSPLGTVAVICTTCSSAGSPWAARIGQRTLLEGAPRPIYDTLKTAQGIVKVVKVISEIAMGHRAAGTVDDAYSLILEEE